MRPLLLIIAGYPGTGKTTLLHKLEKDLSLPGFSKDELKEALFDKLGWSDKVWSQKLSLAAYRIIDQVIETHLRTGNSVIIESNFIRKFDSERIDSLVKKFDARALQIVLHTDEAIRSVRYQERNISGNRHPGHHDLDVHQEHLPREKYEPLDINAPIIFIDTTDFAKVNYQGLIEQIKRLTC